VKKKSAAKISGSIERMKEKAIEMADGKAADSWLIESRQRSSSAAVKAAWL